jgi:hypothetical protein
MTTHRLYRYRACSQALLAWLVAAKRPNGAMRLYHLGTLPIMSSCPCTSVRSDADLTRCLPCQWRADL